VPFRASSTANEWWALLGIPLDVKPGGHELSLTARAADGVVANERLTLTVNRAQFATRRLTVDPSFVDPPASAAERIAREAKTMAEIFAHPSNEPLWHGAFVLPVPGEATSSFGRLSVLNGRSRGRHQGTDFRAAEGTRVVAPNDGRVVLAADHYFSGNTIVIDHGAGLFSVFAHFSRITAKVGTVVARGDLLGESGSTGRVTGPHLHWTARVNSVAVDPLSLVFAVAETHEPARALPLSVILGA
jgi:murein DD-endopeptidase MepM/ murein hydrolase activator NlpD